MPKILVIEDRKEVRELLEIFLTKKGFEVLTAATGEEGVARAKEETPDLVLTDMNLLDLSGREVLRRIKDFRKTLKVVLLSGLYTEELRDEVLSEGATAFLDKGEGVGVIVQAVSDLLS